MYLDSYLIINFLMDLFALILTAKIMNIPTVRMRMVLSSASGTLFSFLCFFLPGFVSKMIAILFPFVMSILAFGRLEIRRTLQNSGLILAISFLAGGIISAINYLLKSILPGIRVGLFLIVFSAFLCLMIIKAYYSRLCIKLKALDCRVDFKSSGKTYSYIGLIDSADFLTEKNSGLPVIIISSHSGLNICSDIEIPLCGAGGSSVLYGFIPDEIIIKKGQHSKDVRAVIAVDGRRESFAGYDCLVPLCVV